MNFFKRYLLLTVLCNFSATILTKQMMDESKHLTIAINNSTKNQFLNNNKNPVNNTIKTIHADIAAGQARNSYKPFHDEYNTLNQLKDFQKNQILHVRISALDHANNQKILSSFTVADDVKIPVDVPAIFSSKMYETNKTKTVRIEISPIADFARAQKLGLCTIHDHLFKKLSNKQTIKISASESTAKKYAPKID
jgi:hypothetical protein